MSLAPTYIWPDDTPATPYGIDPPNAKTYELSKITLGNSEYTPWIVTPRGVYKILLIVDRSAGQFTVSVTEATIAEVKAGSPVSIDLTAASAKTKYELESHTAIKVTGDASFVGSVSYRAVTL